MLGYKSKRWWTKELLKPKALPMGRQEFHEWSIRIIEIAKIPGATIRSQQFALANMLMHLSPTTAHECDGYFVNALKKFAINQVADTLRVEIRDEEKARIDQEQKAKPAEVVALPNNQDEAKILAN